MRQTPSAMRQEPCAQRHAPSGKRQALSAKRQGARRQGAERRAPSAERRAPSAECRAPSAKAPCAKVQCGPSGARVPDMPDSSLPCRTCRRRGHFARSAPPRALRDLHFSFFGVGVGWPRLSTCPVDAAMQVGHGEDSVGQLVPPRWLPLFEGS